MVPTFRWERRFSTVVGDAFRWIGRWIRPMTSLTRRGRIQSGSSSRCSLRSSCFGLQPDLPMADQLRVSKDNLACSFVLTELQALADRGGGSVRENPLRSLHSELTQEKQMMATGLWQDTLYSACCFMGARCKAQRLRHNIDEIAQWPALHCHHTHAADEWQPYLQDGQRVFPSKEEAEYTASLAFGIAVSASWWAARMGLAKLHVPRFPFVETAGRREHWLQIDPRALREWAMAPTAIALGLRPTHPEERARTPHRTRVVDVILEDKTLPPGVVYVGRGHHSHRLPVTKWSSPFVPGHNCDPSSWLPLYVEHIMQHLAGDLPELTGCVLACDCEMHMVGMCACSRLFGCSGACMLHISRL